MERPSGEEGSSLRSPSPRFGRASVCEVVERQFLGEGTTVQACVMHGVMVPCVLRWRPRTRVWCVCVRRVLGWNSGELVWPRAIPVSQQMFLLCKPCAGHTTCMTTDPLKAHSQLKTTNPPPSLFYTVHLESVVAAQCIRVSCARPLRTGAPEARRCNPTYRRHSPSPPASVTYWVRPCPLVHRRLSS